MIVLLHMLELRGVYLFSIATWCERSSNLALSCMRSQEILASVLVLVTNGVGLELSKRLCRYRFAPVV